jgi:hypothetical protein
MNQIQHLTERKEYESNASKHSPKILLPIQSDT